MLSFIFVISLKIKVLAFSGQKLNISPYNPLTYIISPLVVYIYNIKKEIKNKEKKLARFGGFFLPWLINYTNRGRKRRRTAPKSILARLTIKQTTRTITPSKIAKRTKIGHLTFNRKYLTENLTQNIWFNKILAVFLYQQNHTTLTN